MAAARPWRVLMVEDSHTYRQVFAEALLRRFPRMEVIEAEDLTEGRLKFQEVSPRLVFLDIGLPDGNGLDLLREIRKAAPGTRVVICTSHDMPEYRKAALLSGADGFMRKHRPEWEEVGVIVRSAFEEENEDRGASIPPRGGQRGRPRHPPGKA